MRGALLPFVMALTVLLSLISDPTNAAEDYNFAGSVQLDYHLVPYGPRNTTAPGIASTFQGFTTEAALKVAVDVSDHLSANVKTCYGCHGLEIDMAYFDYRQADELNLRVGRFSPSFGAFNLRHDPANHMLSDKPLPYDMGRMLRRGDWNNGVLPAPFPSDGVEVSGTHWFGATTQADYAAYAVSGLKNDNDPNPADFNFQASHRPYYIDSAIRPAFGSRLSLTVRLDDNSDVTVGGSGMYGTYDPHQRFNYLIAGGDVALRVHRTTLRVEYLLRRQQFDTSNPSIFKYAFVAGDRDSFLKQGAFVELEQPVARVWDFTGRVDGLYWRGNVSNVPAGSGTAVVTAVSPLLRRSYVARLTLGAQYELERNFRFKSSVELWKFNYSDSLGREQAISFHFGAVGSF